MKKITTLTASALGFLTTAVSALAAPLDVPIQLRPPDNKAINPDTSLNTILQNGLKIIFFVAVLAVLFMLIWGAFQWIVSGGDKEAVGKARGRITAALIGLAILALAFFIVAIVGQLLGINFLDGLKIPALTDSLTPTPAPNR